MDQVRVTQASREVVPFRRWLIGLGAFSAFSAVGGAVQLLIALRGNDFWPRSAIQYTPFETFLVPALLLGGVVGGTSLVSAITAWRRSRFALDAAILAGGALTFWIVAELGLMRGFHFLHAFYGGLGLAILGLGALGAARSGEPRHRWILWVTAGETLGFLAPMLTGILATSRGVGEGERAVLVTLAGGVEGLWLGAAQAWAFPLPLARLRYALLTALGAMVVWGLAMTLVFFGRTASGAVMIPLGIVIGLVALGAMGAAQWLELRECVAGAERWIGWTALAWMCALPWSFAPSPLVDETTPFWAHVLLWASAGALMAYVLSLVTWQGVRRIVLDRAG